MNKNKVNSFSFFSCKVAGAAGLVLLILLDQWTKFLAIQHLKGQDSFSILPGVLELKYLENTGMAFGMLAGRQTLFLVLCILFFIAAIYLFFRIPKNRYYLPLLFILLFMAGGAAGNFIDRLFRGYVVDFIYFSLINFPIFNLADVYVVGSGIFLVFFVCLKYKDEDFAFISPKYKG